ncbi:hypothetical protein OJF2_66910 [Aquisphaera giovannonii]|uniref:Uncharacterized protein n=1 Tax=Aquisphaera giovannonii TaxID=406548 RepID=A0A5B9WC84_9BACT|nr:hypothetical protein [Aquisphaera giovannonii]QEH38093.1 hypothetical protein OJF2_66910 [Aquisphaera giovannonii]
MRFSRPAAAFAVSVVVVATVTLGALAQSGQFVRDRALPKPDEIVDARAVRAAPAVATAIAYNPAMEVTVNPDLQLDAPSQLIYQQMANTLKGSGFVPNARLTYYSSVNNQGSYSITGWLAFIENVQPDGSGGYIVTISVSPAINDASYSLNSVVADFNYTEKYHIPNNSFTYIDSFDAEGLAGQYPAILRL